MPYPEPDDERHAGDAEGHEPSAEGVENPERGAGAMPAWPPGVTPPSGPPAWPPGPPPPEPPTAQPGGWSAPWAASSPTTARYGPLDAPRPQDLAVSSNGAGHHGARRRRRVVVVLLSVVLVLALLVGGVSALFVTSSTSQHASRAATRLLDSSLDAAASAGSFHYLSRSLDTANPQVTIGDAGRDSGRQVITDGSQHFTIVVVGAKCFFKGNAAAMEANLGLDAATAAAHAQRWISLAPGDAPYAATYAAVTAPSALADNIAFRPQQVLRATTVDAERVITIEGDATSVEVAGQRDAFVGTATLQMAASRPRLPLRYVERATLDGQEASYSVAFSAWGEAVDLVAPSGAVAYSSLAAAGGVAPSTGPTVLT